MKKHCVGMPKIIGQQKLLDEKINEYYEKFIKQEEKSILTYLLYALYDFTKEHKK